ncbi:MAG: DDE-type integrase/transposase/recombinase [Paracoccaceae bacterium]
MTSYSETYFGRFHIKPHDKITIRGRALRLAHQTRDGYVLMDADGSGIAEMFDFGLLSRLNANKEITHEPDFYNPNVATRRPADFSSQMSQLTDKQRMRLHVRHALVSGFVEMRDEALVSVNSPTIKKNMPEICRRAQTFMSDEAPSPETILRENEVRDGSRRKPRGGCVTTSVAPVHPRTLRKWLASFNEFGMTGLADSIANRGNRTSYFSAEEKELLMRTVYASYLSLNRPSQKTTADDVKVAFHKENMKRNAQGLTPLRVPSRQAVRNAIRSIDKFQVVLKRKGLEEAVKIFRPVSSGLQVCRPYERVEMDEWKIDLITIMAASGLMSLFTKEELQLVGLDNSSGRWWITVSIDCRTRCVLGMKLTLNPTSCAALDCLRMTTSDKGVWADAVGAVSGWHMAATPETLVTDNGSAFKALNFSAACSDLGITHERSIAGLPSMRGTVERLFRTASMNLLPRLNGRTFSSVLEKGSHPSEALACLKPEDLCFALVRWIVDIYHNTPHLGLGGKTPLEQWDDDMTNGNYTLKASPSARNDRLAFGVTVERQLDKYGVTILGVKYHSEMLSNWYNKFGKQDLNVRWLANDIGAVEVRFGDECHQVQAVLGIFDGVHAQQWLTARRSLKTSDPAKLKWRDDVVCNAISAIQKMNGERTLEFGLITQPWNSERIASAEEALFCGFNIAETEAPTTSPSGQFGRTLRPSEPRIEATPKASTRSVPAKPKATKTKSWKIEKGDQ